MSENHICQEGRRFERIEEVINDLDDFTIALLLSHEIKKTLLEIA